MDSGRCNQARVIQAGQDWALVEVDRSSMCRHCPESGACGMLTESGRKVRTTVANPVEAVIGDRVEIEINEGVVFWGTIILYALPLATMLVFILVAFYLDSALGLGLGSNVSAGLGAVAGVVISLPLVRFLSRKWKYLSEGGPVITRVLEHTGAVQ